jgi:hypothetical protein
MRLACSVLAVLLLVRFAWDFARGMHLLLGIPAALLAAAAIAACVFAVRSAPAPAPAVRLPTVLAAFAIPFAFAASTFDCMGLSLEGCTTVCTVQKVVVLPLVAVASAWRKPRTILALSLLMLVPHCTCLNVVNAWWIHAFGVSPMCFAWGFVGAVIGVSVLEGRGRPWLSLGVTYASSLGTAGFFVGHHYFHFPW